jgi:hypothetical protein
MFVSDGIRQKKTTYEGYLRKSLYYKNKKGIA